MVPAPAINGNASGTIETVSGASSLNIVNPKTISMANANITNEPAIANDCTSTPITFNKVLPANKKMIISTVATIDAFSDCMCPAFFLKSIIIGIDPSMSMMAIKS